MIGRGVCSVLFVDRLVVSDVSLMLLSVVPVVVMDLVEEVVVRQFSEGVVWVFVEFLLFYERLFDVVEDVVWDGVEDLVSHRLFDSLLEHGVESLDSVVLFVFRFQDVKFSSEEFFHLVTTNFNFISSLLVLDGDSESFFVLGIDFPNFLVLLVLAPLILKLLIIKKSLFDIFQFKLHQQGTIFLLNSSGEWVEHSLEKRSLWILALFDVVQLSFLLIVGIKIAFVGQVLLSLVKVSKQNFSVLGLVVSNVHILEIDLVSFSLVDVLDQFVSLLLHPLHVLFTWVGSEHINLLLLQGSKFLSESLLSEQLLEFVVSVEYWSSQFLSPPWSISILRLFLWVGIKEWIWN